MKTFFYYKKELEMTIKKTLFAALLLAGSASAFAANFEGVFFQMGTGSASTSVDASVGYVVAPAPVSTLGAVGTASTSLPTQTSMVGSAELGFEKQFGVYNLGISAFRLIGDQKGGSTFGDFRNASAQLSDTWGVTLRPGLPLFDNGLAYLKLSYAQTTLTGSMLGVSNGVFGQVSQQQTVKGVGFGFGVKEQLAEHLYGFAELEQFRYSSATFDGVTIKPSSLVAQVGLGYKF